MSHQVRIEARDVLAGYGDGPVLQHISLTLPAGEFLGLIGPNGAGKSTLLRVLSRVLVPAQGAIRLNGEALERLKPHEVARRLAFVPQSESVLFEFTVRDVVLMGRHPYVQGLGGETEEDFAAAVSAMAAADVLHLADRPVTTLSGGEHRRVLVARALAQDAPVLLLDEPTAHLDITHQSELLALMRRLTDRHGTAVLAALHDLNLAAEFCDRLILLAGGRIVAEGSPEHVLTTETLARAYGARLHVGRSPASGKPFIYPAGAATPYVSHSTRRIHVVCGGGTGLGLLAALQRRGYQVTAGVLNLLDSDEQAAASLGIEHVTEAPFSPIGPAARAACLDLMDRAESVVIADVPIGRGNLANIELAAQVQTDGKPVILFGDTPIAERDFTDGAARDVWQRLLQRGAVEIPDLSTLEHILATRMQEAGDTRQ